jgi:hypothetical protein
MEDQAEHVKSEQENLNRKIQQHLYLDDNVMGTMPRDV